MLKIQLYIDTKNWKKNKNKNKIVHLEDVKIQIRNKEFKSFCK